MDIDHELKVEDPVLRVASGTGEAATSSGRVGRDRRHWPLLGAAFVGVALAAWGVGRGTARAVEVPHRPVSSEGEPMSSGQADLGASLGFKSLPPRRSGHGRAPAQIPEVPPELEAPPSLTAEYSVRGAHGPAGHTVFTRSAERVHVQKWGGGVEWLFVRNPVDPRRVSGVLIEHQRQTLVDYGESELAMVGLGRGWADIASLGVRSELVGEADSGAGSELHWGHRFTERHSDAGPGAQASECWWSPELALAERISSEGPAGAQMMVLESLRMEIDEELLRDPAVRFPSYARMDVADYREKHHEHGAGEHEAHAGGS